MMILVVIPASWPRTQGAPGDRSPARRDHPALAASRAAAVARAGLRGLGHVPLVMASIPHGLSTLGGAGRGHVLGRSGTRCWARSRGRSDLATKFILTTIAALVKMLIPHSWVHKGLQIMQWIVAVPDYAGKVTSPGGGQRVRVRRDQRPARRVHVARVSRSRR